MRHYDMAVLFLISIKTDLFYIEQSSILKIQKGWFSLCYSVDFKIWNND